MTSTYNVLQKFQSSCDNWESYSERLKQHFSAYDVPADEQVAILLAVLSPPVHTVLRDLCHPELPQSKTYSELSELLKMHHSLEASVLKERIEFHQAAQAADESFNEWFTRAMSLAVLCKFRKELDSMLRDKFVSGLVDPRIISRLGKERETLTLICMVDIALKMEKSLGRQNPEKSLGTEQCAMQKCCTEHSERTSSSVCNILELPEEMLREIILYLDARERLPLGNSCKRFNSLIFKDTVLLRDLSFSKNAHLTAESEILPYFEDKSTWKHIRKLNLQNVKCIEPGYMLNYSIGKANTLVDINIHGIEFKDIQQLGCFLKPLSLLERLSVDWPKTTENDIPVCCQVLPQPFQKLRYLSVKICGLPWAREFICALQLCQVLRQLILRKEWPQGTDTPVHVWNIRPKKLSSLKIIDYSGPNSRVFKEHFVTLLPDSEKWTDFQATASSSSDQRGFYLVKNVRVSEKLLGSEVMERIPNYEPHLSKLGSAVFSDVLFKEVLKVTHANLPEKFCCLSTLTKESPHLLKPKEAKHLLENPEYQISYLCIDHDIKPNCDVHLVAAAFPKLTELVLSTIRKSCESTTKNTHPERRLRKQGSSVPEEQDDLRNINLDSSFKLLIEKTPYLRHVTLEVEQTGPFEWDLPTLDLISGWQNLQTLHLVFHTLILQNLAADDLIKSTNSRKKVISSMEQLLQRCSQLTAVLCEIGCAFKSTQKKLSPGLERLNRKLRRPNLRIKVVLPCNWRFWSDWNGTWILKVRWHCLDHAKLDVDEFFSLTEKTPVYHINRRL